jgi:hypothetical protein
MKKVDPKDDSPIRLGVTIHDAPLSADWARLWLRLLAPLASEASRHAPTMARVDGAEQLQGEAS